MSTQTADRPDRVAAAADALWLGVPRRILRRFPGSRGVAGDGYFVTTVPPLALLLPVLVVVTAFAVGAGRLGYDVVYTESTPLLAAAIALGCFSTQLGALAVTSFAAGEFFVAERSWSMAARFGGSDGMFSTGLLGNLAHKRIPLLVTYLLLGVAVVVLPRTARTIVLAVGRFRRIPAPAAWTLGTALCAVLVWVGVDAWAAAAPTLVRPIFTWAGSTPTTQAVQPLQAHAGQLTAAAVFAILLRQAWIAATMLPGTFHDRLRAAEDSGSERIDRSSDTPRVRGVGRRLVGDVVTAVLGTLTLAGILESVWIWILALSVFLGVRVLRSDLVRLAPLETWKRVTSRAPAWARLVALWLIARVLTDALSTKTISSYTGLALFVCAGVLLAFAVFPGAPGAGPAGRSTDPEAPTDADPPGGSPLPSGPGPLPPGPPPAPLPATPPAGLVVSRQTPQYVRPLLLTARLVAAAASSAFAGLASLLLTARPAAADNCSVFTDCFRTANSAAEAGFGLALLAGLSLVLDFIPVVGTVKGVVESATGRDLLTGDELAPWERVLGVVPFGKVGKIFKHADEVADITSGIGRHADDLAGAAAGAGRHADDLAGAGQPRLRGALDPSHRKLLDDYINAGQNPKTSQSRRTKLAEQIGEAGGLQHLQDITRQPGLEVIRPVRNADVAGLEQGFDAGQAWPHAVAFNGRNATNLVYFDGKTLHIIEAKGGDAAYGTRISKAVDPSKRMSQTHPQYPQDVAYDMMNSGRADGRNEIGAVIERAYQADRVRYVGVRTGTRSQILNGTPAIRADAPFRQPTGP